MEQDYRCTWRPQPPPRKPRMRWAPLLVAFVVSVLAFPVVLLVVHWVAEIFGGR